MRRNPVERFLRWVTERVQRSYEACADWILSKTVGSSLFRRSSETQRYAKWKLAVFLDETWLKATTIIRRRAEPGRKAQSKLLAAWERLVYDGIVPVVATLTAPFRWIFRKLMFGAGDLFDRAASDPRLRYVVLPFQYLFQITAAIADFVVAWLWTRNYRALLFGLPAIVLLMPLTVCLIRIPLHGAHTKARQYQRAAFNAIREKEFQRADLLFRKLKQLGIDRPSVVYSEATVLAEQGELEAAYDKMKSIAPIDLGGFAPAHLWIAKAIYGNVLEVPEGKRLPLMKRHLDCVLDQFPGDPLATKLLADVTWQSGRQDDAVSMMDGMAGSRLSPGSQASMARTFSQWGQSEQAHKFATMAVAGYEAKIDEVDTLTLGDFFLWTAATELAKRDEQTIAVVKLMVENVERDEAVMKFARGMTLGVLDANWPTRERWLELAGLALRVEPLRDDVMENIVSHAAATDRDEIQELSSRVRELALEVGELSPRGHQLLADLALKAGDHLTARDDYLNLIRQDEKNLKAFNNLAWLSANVEPIDLSDALHYANKASELAPDDGAILETRGQIHVQLKRWDAAIRDLEAALNGLPSYAPIHDSLAKCYDQTGRPELAEAHRQRATAIRSEQR